MFLRLTVVPTFSDKERTRVDVGECRLVYLNVAGCKEGVDLRPLLVLMVYAAAVIGVGLGCFLYAAGIGLVGILLGRLNGFLLV